MLKFIENSSGWTFQNTKISKHLMLKFIVTTKAVLTSFIHFKTSYVEVYLHKIFYCNSNSDISKHLMLKFIPHFLVTFIYFPLHFS